MGMFKKLNNLFKKKIDALKNRECECKMVSAHRRLFTSLYKSKLVENALNVGDKMPLTQLQDCFGEKIDVTALLEKGPLVVKFFRGTWCHYCNTDLQFLNEQYEAIRSLGANAIAISTQPEANSQQAIKDNGLSFPIITDHGSITKAFRLNFQITDEVTKIYRDDYEIDLQKVYGKTTVDVALPATYVFDRNGVVIYAYLDEDFRNRANIDEVLSFVRKATKINKQTYATKIEQEDCVIREAIKSLSKKFHERHESLKGALKPGKTKSKDDLFTPAPLELNNDPFRFCLQTEEFLDSFRQYLTLTYCTENLLFYFEAAEFQKNFATKTAEENKAEATRIFETFVRIGSDLEVNIDDTTREALVAQLREGQITADLFAKSSHEIYQLMESDSFTKWKRTHEFNTIWKKTGSLPFLAPSVYAAEAA